MMKPFADDSRSVAVGGLTVENGRDKVAMYGSLDLTRDKAGLEHARALRALLDAAIQAMEADPALPTAIPLPKPAQTVKNPFGEA